MRDIMKKLLVILLLLSLCACTKKEAEVTESDEPDIAGKTFYNGNVASGAKEASRLWLGKDGSFVLTDVFSEGLDEINGSWTIKEGVVTLNVDSGGGGKYSKVILEAMNENTLVLKSTLTASKSDDVFSTTRPEIVIPPEDENNTEAAVKYTTYYNTSHEGKDKASYLELRDDRSFALVERNNGSIMEINGLYGRQASVYMFSNFDPFTGADGSKIYNFEFEIVEDGVLRLMEDLCDSKKDDFFCIDGVTPPDGDDPFAGVFKTTTWIHEPIADVSEQYLPKITIATDYSFKFVENCYSGMGSYQGYCQKLDDGWACDVLDASKMQGFKGDDVKVIKFKANGDGSLTLETELCMSMAGDVFN